MRTILVPVDGSDCSDGAVQEVVAMVQKSGPVDLHLINVQPRIFAEESLVFLPQDKTDTYYFEQSEKALASAGKLLQDAGVEFTAHRSTGPIAEGIIAKAHELSADGIVMGTHGHGKLTGMLLGSVCMKVLHLSDIPVTVVRREPALDFTDRLSAT
jgi:nucleotide-binding universal stress UspA family protein